MAKRSETGYSTPLGRIDEITLVPSSKTKSATSDKVKEEKEQELKEEIKEYANELRKEGFPVNNKGRINLDALKGAYSLDEIERRKKFSFTVDEIRSQQLPYWEKLYARIYAHFYNFDPSWYCRGFDLLTICKFNEAIKCFDKVIEIHPNFRLAWLHKCICLMYLQKFYEALKCCDKVIELAPNLEYPKRLREEILAKLQSGSME